MNLMARMERGLVHGWTSTGRIFAFVGACLCVATGFAEESISITATPRYPWNGKVDLKFEVGGEATNKYSVSFSAKDVAGGTNLTMKTLYKSDGTAVSAEREQLLPGTYNWVWDATADLTTRWVSYASCVPTSSTVLFKDTQLAAIGEVYAVPCGNAINDKSNRAKGRWIKTDGVGKSVQFAFSDDKYTKCVCVHFEQSGADVVGYVKWARYVGGLGREDEDFDANSATTQTIATSETARGYGLCKMEARASQPNPSVVLDRVVVEGKVSNPLLPVMAGLVAYYPFDGDVKDYSGNGFHLSGSTVSWIADQKGNTKKAASFAGGSDLKLNSAMNVKDTMTFVAWLAPTKNSDDEDCWPNWQWNVGGSVHLGRVNAGLGWCAWPMIIAPIDSKSVGISVGTKLINVFQNSGNFDCLLSYRSDFTGQWIHIAITIDNRAAPVLYVNGTKVSAGSTAFLESPLSISSTLGFGGASLWHAGMWYKGGVNDFAIYNRVLSATEVKSLCDAGK